MKNREWLYVTACCEEPFSWKTIAAAEAPARMRRRSPDATGFTVAYCPGCGQLSPRLVQGCQPWEAVGLPNPERIERGLSELAPLAARLATAAYLQAIANACAFNRDRGCYESGADEERVLFDFKITVLADD